MILTLIKYRHLMVYSAAVIALIVSVWYIHQKGYKACQREIAAITAQSQIDSLKKVNDVKKEEQSIDDSAIDAELCNLRIMRGGC